MSSLHEGNCDGGCATDEAPSAVGAPEESRSEPAGTHPLPSYSTHFHLNYVTTFHGAENSVGDRHAHQIFYSCRPDAGMSGVVPQRCMEVTCKIDVKADNDELCLHIDSSNHTTGPVLTPGAHRTPENPGSTDDALKSAREQRTAAINEMFGIWKDRDDIPDGLQFQKEMRDEWR